MDRSYLNSLFGNINTSINGNRMDSPAGYLNNASNAFNSASNILQRREELDVLNRIRESQNKQIDIDNESKQFQLDLAREQKELQDKAFENFKIVKEQLSTIAQAGVDRTTSDLYTLFTNGGVLDTDEQGFRKDTNNMLSKASGGKVNTIEEYIKNPEKSLYKGLDKSVFDKIEKYWKLKQDLNMYQSGAVTNEELYQLGNATYQTFAVKGQDYNIYMKPFIEYNDSIKNGLINDKINRAKTNELDLFNIKTITNDNNKTDSDIQKYIQQLSTLNNINNNPNANTQQLDKQEQSLNNDDKTNSNNEQQNKNKDKYERIIKFNDVVFQNNENNKDEVNKQIEKSFSILNDKEIIENSQELMSSIVSDSKDILNQDQYIHNNSTLLGISSNPKFKKEDYKFIKDIQSKLDEKSSINNIDLSKFDRDKLTPKSLYYYDLIAKAQEVNSKYLQTSLLDNIKNAKDYKQIIQEKENENRNADPIKQQENIKYVRDLLTKREEFKNLKDFSKEQREFIEKNSDAKIILDDNNQEMRSSLLMVIQGFNDKQQKYLLSALSDDDISKERKKLNEVGITLDSLSQEELKNIATTMSNSIREKYTKLSKGEWNNGIDRDPNFYNIALQLLAMDSYVVSIANEDEKGIDRKFNTFNAIKEKFNED